MISIIVPVYNVEKYLTACVESVIAQTYQDWELLLIDDGSPDNSGKICDDYAAKDSRIRVFHKENGGVSSARNLGLDEAKGEWICFIDSDDYVSIDYLSYIDETYDIVFVESKTITTHGDIKDKDRLEECCYSSAEETKEFLSKNLNKSIVRVPWGKILKREFIGNTRFKEGQRIGEDTIFDFQLYQKFPKIKISNGTFYYWREDVVVDRIKYALSPKIAVEYITNIWTEYLKMGVIDHDFEFFLLTCFFSLLDKRKVSNLKFWFNSPVVQIIENRILEYSLRLPRSYTLSRRSKVLGYILFKIKNK